MISPLFHYLEVGNKYDIVSTDRPDFEIKFKNNNKTAFWIELTTIHPWYDYSEEGEKPKTPFENFDEMVFTNNVFNVDLFDETTIAENVEYAIKEKSLKAKSYNCNLSKTILAIHIQLPKNREDEIMDWVLDLTIIDDFSKNKFGTIILYTTQEEFSSIERIKPIINEIYPKWRRVEAIDEVFEKIY